MACRGKRQSIPLKESHNRFCRVELCTSCALGTARLLLWMSNYGTGQQPPDSSKLDSSDRL